jgi:hypothetical protein
MNSVTVCAAATDNSVAASVDVVNGINNYEIIVKATPDRGGNQNFFYSTIPHLQTSCRGSITRTHRFEVANGIDDVVIRTPCVLQRPVHVVIRSVAPASVRPGT